MAFAVDQQHLVRTVPPMDSPMPLLPVDFCVVKRTGIVLYSFRESLQYIKVGTSSSPLELFTYYFTIGHTITRRGIPRPSDRDVSVHR
jgi:hypothetical protein